MSWLAQYFLNPGFVLPGLALASVPVIIHILSRLRYRKVRFAAMEFLLQSDEMNRRRLFIEQLLLLLLRVLAVILICLLLARLVMDPSRLFSLRGASVHHVVIIDDSLSMRDRDGERTVFDEAIAVVERMLADGGAATGTSRVTILLMSEPSRAVISDRTLDGAMLQELTTRLRNLQCSWRAASPEYALETARDILGADGGVSPHVHFVTDFRMRDWSGRPEVLTAMESLKAVKADLNIVRVAATGHSNISLSQITSDSLAIARGIPWRMNLTIRNHGSTKVSGLRGIVRIDGQPVPGSVLVPDIEAGAETIVSHDLVFQSEGRHQVEVLLDEDALIEDNRRYVVVDVSDRRSILIIDDHGQQEDAGYIAAALSADESLTGLTADVRTSQSLTSLDLNSYDCIYLLNIRDLAADAVRLLASYVDSGGGIAWFPDEQANIDWYNTSLREPGVELFPLTLGSIGEVSSATNQNASVFQSLVFEQHPIFAVYNIPDSPFADLIQISKWFQPGDDWQTDDISRADGVQTLARLKNGQPAILEHQHGRGRILTFLVGAGRRWSNWPIAPAAPGFVVMHLLMHPYLQRPADGVQHRELAEPLVLKWPVSQFTENVEVFLPEPESSDDATVDTFVRLQATLPSADSKPDSLDSPTQPGEEEILSVTIRQVDRPGVYRIRRFDGEGNSSETWWAMNAPATESNLQLADADQLSGQATLDHVKVIDGETADALGAGDAGREVRWILLGLLLVILVCEQLLALRMSYHPEGT
ncbi:MAG: VWA domain-containing protein [Planctomycetaceae bacterium]|nr:VWA domain-containing protein [Planctomycetaceae bacterium]